MTESFPPSLREKKRVETWTAIHDTATAITLDKGLEHVTVEAIAEQANISPRTFFNYFATKEDAILGLQEPTIDDHARAEFTIDDNFADHISKLMLSVAQSTFGGSRETSRRFEVLERYPQLIQRRLSYITKMETLVAELVQEHLEASEEWSRDLPEASSEQIAHMIVMLGSTMLRFAMHKGAAGKSHSEQFEELHDASTLLRKIIRKVQ